jgi:hypothetical protein
MANQNAPTHRFGGGITLKGNSFPSELAPDITYGGIATTFINLPGDANSTIAADDGLTFVVAPLTGARVITLPLVGSDGMEGRIYTFYVLTPGAFTLTFQQTGAVAIPSGAAVSTVTTASKSAVVTIIYASDTVVQGNVVIGA